MSRSPALTPMTVPGATAARTATLIQFSAVSLILDPLRSVIDGAPDPLCGRRHVDVMDAERPERVQDGIDDRWRRRDAATLAGPLHAERIGTARLLVECDGECGQPAGAWHRIVHEARRHELAGAVIDRMLADGLADALRERPMHLAANDQRIDQAAEIVNRCIAFDCDRPGVG